MKMDDVIAGLGAPTSAEQIDHAVDLILCADDVDDDQRGAFVCGYLAGLGVAIARRDNPINLAEEMRTRMIEGQLRGWI
jgi:hypothetical protein